MDPLGVLEAVVALAVFPGGIYLAAIVWLGDRASRRPVRARIDAAGLAWLVAADLAVAQAPLAGSPATILPPSAGAPSNVVVVLLVLSAAAALTGGSWKARRVIAGVATGMALLVPAAGAASLSLPSITGQPGGLLLGARACAAATLLLAGPLLANISAGPATPATIARRGLLGAVAVLALSLITPPSLRGWAAVGEGAAVGILAAGYLAATGALHAALARRETAVAVLSTAAGAITIAVAALGAR